MDRFKYDEPNFLVNPLTGSNENLTKEQEAAVVDEFLRKIVQKINFSQECFFPVNIFVMSVDDFLQIIEKMSLAIPFNHLEVVIKKFCVENKENSTKKISLSVFIQALKDYGMNIEEDNYIDEEFPSKLEVNEEDKYSDSFESSKMIEEAIQEQIENETELDFIEYGIKIDSK